MDPPTIILDTNILIAALRSGRGASARLIRELGSDTFDIGLTVPLVLEYESVAKRFADLTLSGTEIDEFIGYICDVGIKCAVDFLTRPAARDPGDEFVIEAAVASGSDWIVTFNARDLTEGAARYGVEVIAPNEALKRLGITS